jgi:putative aldouronate transport system permease protein
MLGIAIAFQDYNIFAGTGPIDAVWKSDFVGFANFIRVMGREEFMLAMRNTFVISGLKIAFLFPLPIILALMLNSIRSVAYKRVAQTIVYIPHFFSWVIVAGIFMTLLSMNGIVNQLFVRLGRNEAIPFFMDPSLFRWLLIFTDAWKEVGWGTIVYLAAIAGIDQEMYEAAHVDGARPFQQLVSITLPSLTPTIVLLLTMRVAAVMDAGFGQILVMYNPTVYATSDIIQTYVYRIGLGKMDFSMGTAVGVFNSGINFILMILANAFSRRMTGRGIW